MPYSTKRSGELYKKGLEHLVGSVNSPVRAFNSVGGNPIFIEKAMAEKIVDVDGNQYIGQTIKDNINDDEIPEYCKKVLAKIESDL